MYDWEQYYKRSSALKDDPWDMTPEQRKKKRTRLRKKQMEHPYEEDHVIGSCGPDVSFSSANYRAQRKKSSNPAKVIIPIIIAVVVLFNLVTILVETAILDDGDFSFSYDEDISPDDQGDGFTWPEDDDVISSGEVEDSVDIWEPEEGPSEMEYYTGDINFSLQLRSSDGLQALSYQEIYAKVLPSVVTITVYNDYSGAYATGIILSEDGYILTNQHVVACQTHAQVTTNDNRTYDALLVGEDPNTDLALLKIEATGLTPAELASSDTLQVGDECFAIGNPLGVTYRASFTNGIISALERNVNMGSYTMTLIQTNAALNSGNSGGPLINIYGQVVGINNMKIMATDSTIEGMGFAIPTTTAKRVTDAIIQYGVVEHPVIGITCYAVTAGDMDGNEVDGVFVYTIAPDSDAARQGLEVGDIITHINGQRIYQVSDVDLTGMRVGDQLTVTVYRLGETLDITFALVEQNEITLD